MGGVKIDRALGRWERLTGDAIIHLLIIVIVLWAGDMLR